VVIRGVVLDMDDTLYLEREYVRSGFAAVARAAGGSDVEVVQIEAWLWTAFEAGVRGDTFDRLRDAFPEVGVRRSTADLVEVYRAHPPEIALANGVRDTLDRLAGMGLRLGVLSDGPVESQSAKVAALGLERWFEPIILTGALDATFAKPGTAGFESIARAWGLPAAELVYVGDNPAKDFVGPRALGWATVQLVHPRQVRDRQEPIDDRHRADHLIADLTDLIQTLSLEDD
jgi:putative hydrolase of the HAD superfamily